MRTIKRDIVGAFIFSSDDKLLLGKTGVYQDLWVIPGGGVNKGESKKAALSREILEETGINISKMQIEAINKVIEGQSRKILRDTKEEVLVRMKFYNYKVFVGLPAKEIILNTKDDFYDAFWAPVSELKGLSLASPSVTTLKLLGYL